MEAQRCNIACTKSLSARVTYVGRTCRVRLVHQLLRRNYLFVADLERFHFFHPGLPSEVFHRVWLHVEPNIFELEMRNHRDQTCVVVCIAMDLKTFKSLYSHEKWNRGRLPRIQVNMQATIVKMADAMTTKSRLVQILLRARSATGSSVASIENGSAMLTI